ncbi:hypothetical protein BDV95DRAFT_382351 [Massariosphaeria phaeospora]|uniref:LsmAD domain-containing protein n=1 Tax=Massariosphaeria phaeospora TaxID=100035 RepID=A0A7C8MAY6_9PLEO|nr:hypothetical protein BDV95DRAFT_382351 [Massariosphaeria phaeospora]
MSSSAAAAASANGSNANGPLSSSTTSNPPTARTQLKMNPSGKAVDGPRKQAGSPVDGAHRKPPPQKAWTHGTNPITQRASNVNNSNGVVNGPKLPQNPVAVTGETASPMRHLNDRMMYLLSNLIGLPGNITLKNGETYTGVLSGTSLDPSEMRYVFKMVKRVQPAIDAQVNGSSEMPDDYVGVGDSYVMSFDMGDVADFSVPNVILDKTQGKPQNGASGFRTDTDISGHMPMRERKLEKWDGSADTNVNLSLESSGRSSEWDQFSTNEQLFGVKSNYDESFYTTTINRNDPQYAARAARAEKLAREIEGSSALNAHVREERGGRISDEKGEDEEEKYSGVRRDFPALPSGQPNRYTPPARRAPTGQPTVSGAPVDPAIISSQLARPGSTAAKLAQSPSAENRASPETGKAEVAPNPNSVVQGVKLEVAKDTVPKAEAKTAPPTKPAADQAQKPSTTMKPLLDQFKQFSASEKLRMVERQRSLARESKAVKLNDLKKFSLNFKLHTPVPTDLVPILAKDENKQQLIVEKALRAVQQVKTTPPKPAAATVVDPKASTRTGAIKPEPIAHPSPGTSGDRQQNQRGPRPGQTHYGSATMRERPNQNQNVNQIPPRHGLLGTRLTLNQQHNKQQGTLPFTSVPQPIPVQPPTGLPTSGVRTPPSSASTRFNVKANEFRPNPAANTFLPGPSTNSSPRSESVARQEPPRKMPMSSFFGPQRPTVSELDLTESFNPIKRLLKDAQENNKVTEYAHNGGIPAPFRTPPTWDFPETNKTKGYLEMFEHSAAPPPASTPHSAMGNGPIPHQHQLPPHLQGPQGVPPQGQTPNQTPRHLPVQPHHNQGPHHFEAQQMQYSHSNSSVHPSPRPMPPYMYSSQQQPMSGYAQQVPMQQHYGMSPGIQHAGLRVGHGGPQYANPPAPGMGGQMMTNQPSNGPYMGIPTNPQMPMYSPAPAHAYPHYQGQIPTGPGANGFPSPRPGAPMMSHQGSQQGHQQQPLVYMQHGGQGPPMFAQVPPGSIQ